MRTVAVIDYGMGNIGSLENAFNYLGYDVSLYSEDKKIKSNLLALTERV